jgi:nucleotide-binding universal stress UspA family protein
MTNQGSRPVVAGVDDSEGSRIAVEWAAREARRRHTGLRLVHGYVQPVPYATLGYPAHEYQIEAALRAARGMLARTADAVSAAHPEVPVERALLGGVPAGVLVEESATACLVVVGGRGRGGFPGLLTGSVATQVAAHAHGPVVVVRSGGDPAGPVVVGVDGSPPSTTALGFAFEHASGCGLPLVAVYGWRALPTTNLGPVTARHWSQEEAALEARRMLAEQLAGWSGKYPDVSLEQRPMFSFNPAETLVDLSGTASLVVVGSRGRGGFAGLLLGSVSRGLVHHAAGPVAVVHPYR